MIRFIDLGKQIAADENDPDYPREFAFYDTVSSKFLRFDGQSCFESYEDLLEQMEGYDPKYMQRIVGLVHSWVPRGKPTRLSK